MEINYKPDGRKIMTTKAKPLDDGKPKDKLLDDKAKLLLDDEKLKLPAVVRVSKLRKDPPNVEDTGATQDDEWERLQRRYLPCLSPPDDAPRDETEDSEESEESEQMDESEEAVGTTEDQIQLIHEEMLVEFKKLSVKDLKSWLNDGFAKLVGELGESESPLTFSKLPRAVREVLKNRAAFCLLYDRCVDLKREKNDLRRDFTEGLESLKQDNVKLREELAEVREELRRTKEGFVTMNNGAEGAGRAAREEAPFHQPMEVQALEETVSPRGPRPSIEVEVERALAKLLPKFIRRLGIPDSKGTGKTPAASSSTEAGAPGPLVKKAPVKILEKKAMQGGRTKSSSFAETVKSRKSVPVSVPMPVPVPAPAPAPVPEAGKKEVIRMRRVPRTAAVVVTCPRDGPKEQYTELFRELRGKIKPEEFGIKDVRAKRAMTGALVFEIPGEGCDTKADLLASKLREACHWKSGVRVARPIKMAELRLSRIDESISEEELRSAIAGQGGCRKEDIRIGRRIKSLDGSAAVWAKCPVTAANVLVRDGLRIDWCLVRAEFLEARPVRCYRCSEIGHVGAKCLSETDRSLTCFRCGKDGHWARNCTDKEGQK